MTRSRRHFITAGAGVCATVLAGCVDSISERANIEWSSSPAFLVDEMLTETQYDFSGVNQIELSHVVEIGERTQEAALQGWETTYTKSDVFGPFGEVEFATLKLLTLPDREIRGRQINPLGNLSSEDSMKEFLKRFDNLEDVSHSETYQETIVGQNVDVHIFTGTVSYEEIAIPSEIVFASTPTADDLLIALGIHPTESPEESEIIPREMLTGIEHPADERLEEVEIGDTRKFELLQLQSLLE